MFRGQRTSSTSWNYNGNITETINQSKLRRIKDLFHGSGHITSMLLKQSEALREIFFSECYSQLRKHVELNITYVRRTTDDQIFTKIRKAFHRIYSSVRRVILDIEQVVYPFPIGHKTVELIGLIWHLVHSPKCETLLEQRNRLTRYNVIRNAITHSLLWVRWDQMKVWRYELLEAPVSLARLASEMGREGLITRSLTARQT